MATAFTSVLILEDDADWGEDIHSQMSDVAAAVRKLVQADTTAWPHEEDWDVLWLGHCGESLPFDQFGNHSVSYHDPTIPSHVNSWEKAFEEKTRYVHFSVGPVCSYAYAVSRVGASRILAAEHGNDQAFDIWLHVACRSLLRCISVNPKIFHEHVPQDRSGGLVNSGRVDWSDRRRVGTDNILHSARSRAKLMDSHE